MKFGDVLFWILILGAVGMAIWLAVGSPAIENGLLIITIFIASSEILLWKALFQIDKKTAIGFTKIKHDMEKGFLGVNNRFDKIEDMIKK